MAASFDVKFLINRTSPLHQLQLTDTSTGFTLSKAVFKITYPNGFVANNTDLSSPDISSAGGTTNKDVKFDVNNLLIRGDYVIVMTAEDTSGNTHTAQRSFNLTWKEPTLDISNTSDVTTPEVKFKDNTTGYDNGNFTETITTRTLSSGFPSTSAVSGASAVSGSGTSNFNDLEINVINSNNYYEGVYTPSLSVNITYAHTNGFLSVQYINAITESISIKRAPTQTELLTKINQYKDSINVYKSTNRETFDRLSEQYDLVIGLYSHLIDRVDATLTDGSEPILRELLEIVEPNASHTFQSTPITQFTTTDTESTQDIVGTMVSTNTENGIAVTYDDSTGKLNFDVADFTITQSGDTSGSVTVTNLASATLNSTLATVNSNVGSFGSTTAIPVITVNAKGLVTGVTTAAISTVLTLAADSGSNDTVTIGTDTLTIAGGTGLTTTISNNNISVAIDSTVATLTGSQTLTNKTLNNPELTGTSINVASGGIINFGSNKISISGDTIEKKDGGNLLIKGDDIFIQNEAGTKTIIRAVSTLSYLSGAVLSYNNTEVFRTIDSGVQITGSLTLDNVAVSAVQTASESFADNDTSIMTSAAIDDRINSAILTKDNTDEITEGSSNLYFTNERVDDRVNALLQAGSNVSLSYDDASNTLTISSTQLTNEQVQDVIGGMLGGDETGGISVTYDDTNNEIDFALSSIPNSSLTNSTITVNGTSIALGASGTLDTGDIGEGSNLYFTNERVDDRVNSLVTAGTGITSTYDDAAGTLTLATTITQYTDALARGAISVSGNALSYNSSTGVITSNFEETPTFTGVVTAAGLDLGDNEKIRLGASQDLQIYHDGTNSYIQNGEGDLFINGDTDHIRIRAKDDEDSIVATPQGNVELYSDGNLKLQTTGTGISVTGNIVVSGTVDGVDIAARDAVLTSTTTTANAALPTTGGTMTGNVTFNDGAELRLGNDNDMGLFSSSGVSHIRVNEGTFELRANDLSLKNQARDETYLTAVDDGAVSIYHDNTKKFETTSSGVSITGTATATTFSGDLNGTINTATTATTQSAGDNSTKVATTAYADTAVSNLVDSSPDALNTLNELAAALGDDANFSTTVTNSIATKVAKAGDTMTGNLVLNNSVNLRFKNNAGAERNILTLDTNDDVQFGGSIDHIRFLTNDSSEKMRLTSGGRLGIGVTAPSYSLEVLGDSQVVARFKASNNSTSANNGGALIDIQNTNSTNGNMSSLIFRDSNGNGSSGIFGYHADHSDGEGFLTFGTRNSSGSFAEKMRLDSSGRLGINYTAPSAKLHIETGADEGIRIHRTSVNANFGAIEFRNSDDSATNGRIGFNTDQIRIDGTDEILFINDGSESARFDENGNLGIGITSPTVRLEVSKGAIHKQLRVHRDVNGDNTTMGSILFAGDDSDGNVTDYARIHALSESDNAGSEDGALIFSTLLNSSFNEIMRITSAGRAGVGTSNPLNKLHVSTSDDVTALFQSTDSISRIEFADNNTTGSTRPSIGASGNNTIFTQGTTERMRLDSSGRLGIGSNNPSYKLQVQGTFYVNETAYINGVTTIDASLNQTGGDASTFSGNLSAKKLTSTDGILELDDNGTHNGIINVPASLRINIDSDNNNTGESFQVANNATNIDSNNILFKIEESGQASFTGNLLAKNRLTVGQNTVNGSYGLYAAGSFGVGGNSTFAGTLGIAGSSPVSSSALTIKSTSVSSQQSAIDIIQNGGNNSIIRMGEKSTDGGRFHMFDGGTEKIAFYTDGTDNHISAGNLGIGTESPSQKLHVVGTQIRLDNTAGSGGGYYLHDGSGTFRAALWDNGTNTRLFADGDGSTAAITIESNNSTFAGTITAAGGSSNNNDDANILTLNASQHARLLVDTSSTSGHRATLVLESNGNELTLATTGSASELIPVGDFTLNTTGGEMIFQQDTNDGNINFNCDDGSGGVTTYMSFDGGDTDINVYKNLHLSDNVKIQLGAPSSSTGDFEIHHNSTTNVNHVSSLLDRTLSINANIIQLTNEANNSTYLQLNSTGGTFAGDVKLSTAGKKIIADFSSGGTTRKTELELYNSSDGGFTLNNEHSSTGGLKFQIDGNDALSIAKSDKSATFAGAVNVFPSSLGGSTAMSDGTLIFGAGSTSYYSFRLDSNADLHLDKVFSGTNATVFSIDRSTTNGDITFAGNVDFDGNITLTGSTKNIVLDNSNELRSKDTSGTERTIARVQSGNTLQYGWSGAGNVEFKGGGSYTTRMAISSSNGYIGIGESFTTPSAALHIKQNQGASNDSVLRLRGTNTTNRITRLQLEDYKGTLADGLIQFRIPTADTASSAVLEIGVNSAGLTFDHSNNATFGGGVTIEKSTPTLTFNNLAGGGLDPILTATGTNFTISTSSITPFSLALGDGTLTLDPGHAGNKALKLVGNYSSNGDVKILEFVRVGDAVAGAIEYNDATTDMEIGTVTNHAFSIKTNDTRRLTFANSGAATFEGTIRVNGTGSSQFYGNIDVQPNKKFVTHSSSSGDYIRLYAGSGTGEWDIYGHGNNLRFSENSGVSGAKVVVDTDLQANAFHGDGSNLTGVTGEWDGSLTGNASITGNLTVTGDITNTNSTSIFSNGAYLEIGTGASNTAQLTFNADYDGGQTATYTPHYSGASSAGMSIIKMPSGGVGGLEFFVRNHGTTGGSHALSTFTKLLDLHQDGYASFGGDVRIPQGAFIASQTSLTNPVLRLTNTGVNDYDFTFPDNSTIQIGSNVGTDLIFKLLNAGAGDFNLDVGGDATFAGNITAAFDSNNSGNRFRIADTEGISAAVRTYSTSDGTGLILNHYYAVSGSPYMRYSDFVSNMGDAAATTMRFLTKPHNGNPTLALTIDNSQNATFAGHVKAPFFTSDGGRGFKQDSVTFGGTYSDGSDADAANDLGKETNRWRDLYLYGNIKAYNGLDINSIDQDKDIVFKGNDGGSTVTALTLDMSEGGNATFAGSITTNANNTFKSASGSGSAIELNLIGTNTGGFGSSHAVRSRIKTMTDDSNNAYASKLEFYTNDASNNLDLALKLDSSQNAIFAGSIFANAFYDTTNNSYYLDPSSTSTSLNVAGNVTIGGSVDAASFTDIITNQIFTASGSLDIDTVLTGRDVTFTQGSNNLMTIKGDGTGVGIGTDSPYLPLQISQATSSTGIGSNTSYNLALTNTNTTANNLALIGFNDGDGNAGAMGLQFTDHTNNYGDLLFITRGSGGFSERMRINSSGALLVNTTSQVSGMTFQVNGVSYLQGDNSTNGTIVFTPNSNKGTNQSHIHYGTTGDWYIRPSSNSGKVVIADNATTQLVGIGTASPSSKLHVSGAGQTELRIASTTANTNSLLSFYEGSLPSWGIDAGQANGKFFIKHLYNSTLTRLTIDNAGRVGIGNDSPTNTLVLARSSSGQGEHGLRLEFTDTDGPTNTSSSVLVGSYGLKFKNHNSSRNFLFETGNILMGNSVVNPASGYSDQRGFGYNDSNGNVQIGATDDIALTLGRNKSSDGTILSLRKESNVIGTIGSNSSGGNPVLDIASSSSTSLMRFLTSGLERMRISSTGLTTIKRTGITGVTKNDMTLHIGYEGNNGQNNLIGFGYNGGNAIPAYIGFTTTSGSSNTKGDLVFGTRDVVTDSDPSERMRIASDGAILITSDGSDGDGANLTLKHANNNTSDVIGTIYFGNNADDTLSAIVTETSGANNTSNLVFKTSTTGTLETALTLNADNSATFGGNVTITSTAPELLFSETGSSITNRIYGDGGNLHIDVDNGASSSGNLKILHQGSTFAMFKGSNGALGIGNTSPDESLHITNSSGANIILNTDANTADSGIYMSEGADATPTQNGAYLHYDASANEFKIATGGSSLTDRFTIARDTGNATFAGNVTLGNAGGNPVTLTESSGNFNISADGDINLLPGGVLNLSGSTISLQNSGSTFAKLEDSSDDFIIRSTVSDKDIIFKGNDGGSTITALTLDMSEGGDATFGGDVNVKNASTRFISLNYEDSVNSIISHSGTNFGLENLNVRGDNIYFYTDYDSGTPKGNLTLTLDSSHNAVFAGSVFANAFYDTTNNSYYLDPSSTSTSLNVAGDIQLSTASKKIIADFSSGGTTRKTELELYNSSNGGFTLNNEHSSTGGIKFQIDGADALSIAKSTKDTTFSGDIAISKDVPAIDLVDTNSNSDWRVRNNNGIFEIYDTTNSMQTTTQQIVDGSTASSNAFLSTKLQLMTGAKTGWGDGDVHGSIEFYNNDASGIGARNAASIKAINTSGDGSSTTTFSGNLVFYTSAYNTAETEAMRLDADQDATFAGDVDIANNKAYRINGNRFVLYNGNTFLGDIDNAGGSVYIREDSNNIITIAGGTSTFSGDIVQGSDSGNTTTTLFGNSNNLVLRSQASGTRAPEIKFNIAGTDLYSIVANNNTSGIAANTLTINQGSTAKFFFFSDGNFTCTGHLSKGSGSFKIDHPLESKKDTHHLVHSFIEGPQADLIYRGKVDLVDGKAVVNIDQIARMTEGTFEALNRNVQCFTSNESDWDAVKGSVSGNKLTIECQNTNSTATISWMVVGERDDQHMKDTNWTHPDGKIIMEPLKEIVQE